MNHSTEKEIMDMEDRLVVAKREGMGWMGCLSLEWISNEILLCSIGNYVWSLMMEYDNVRKKECIHVCATGSPCCTAEN